MSEPTIKILLKIADDLDKERGFGSEDLATPITAEGKLPPLSTSSTTSPNNSLTDEDAILVTKLPRREGFGVLEGDFLLTDKFSEADYQLEDERRLFYVAMTRAKEELILCGFPGYSNCCEKPTLKPPMPQLEGFDLQAESITLIYLL